MCNSGSEFLHGSALVIFTSFSCREVWHIPMKYLFSFPRTICRSSIVCFLLVTLFVFADYSPAQAAKGITFSWRANPVEDEVVGYRLYYGSKSRFTSGKYERYIDFTSSKSCPAGTNGYGCEPLTANAVSCNDLFRETPKCTVKVQSGDWYFAMTAYNGHAESNFTHELSTVSPQKYAFLRQVYHLLLLWYVFAPNFQHNTFPSV